MPDRSIQRSARVLTVLFVAGYGTTTWAGMGRDATVRPVPPPVEVLVVSYASAPVIERLLASLATVLPDAPVAIREHSPAPAAVAALERLGSSHTAPVRIEHDPSNPGFGSGCNALAAGSSAQFLAFLNPDTELLSWPWNDTQVPPTGLVIGPIMEDDPHQHYGRHFGMRDEIALSWLRRKPRRPQGTGYVSGAALLIERVAFQRLGGFDPGYFLFYEDIDLCLRANAAGLGTIVEPAWTMRHARHHSTADTFEQSLMWSYDSAVRFYAKQGAPIRAYRAYKVVDSALRAVVQLARRHPTAARGYAALARRALTG